MCPLTTFYIIRPFDLPVDRLCLESTYSAGHKPIVINSITTLGILLSVDITSSSTGWSSMTANTDAGRVSVSARDPDSSMKAGHNSCGLALLL